MPTRRDYSYATDAWRGHAGSSANVRLFTTDGDPIGEIPLEFIRRGGDDSWGYVVRVAQMLVECDPRLPCALTDDNGTAVDLAHAPAAGRYTFSQPGRVAPMAYTRGPETHSKILPADTDGSSTYSHSSRSSVHQSQFRMAVIARDSLCLVTDEVYTNCQACHIVPQSRPDVYRALLDIDPTRAPPLFAPAYGLLLSSTLHRAYDRLEFSFYRKGDDYYVHVFVGTYFSFHGKKLEPSRFRCPPDWRPDPLFMAWHYAQCAKAHIRGFSFGMGMLPGADASPPSQHGTED